MKRPDVAKLIVIWIPLRWIVFSVIYVEVLTQFIESVTSEDRCKRRNPEEALL